MNEVAQKKEPINTIVAASPRPDTVQQALQKMIPQFAMVLPKHLTPERLCRVALNACHSTPKLLDCDRKSLFSAVMRSAQLGLEPDGVLGQAYLIPFKRSFQVDGKWQSVLEVQFIVGYKGLIDLARRSGDVSNIIAKEVYSEDEFSVDWSQEIPFTHKPKMEGERGEVTHFWAMARFKDGGFHWDYLTVAEVNAIRDKGNGGKNAVWKDHYIEMGKKTAIRRIAKYLPMSVQKAAITEDLMDAGKAFSTDSFGDIIIEGTAVDAPESDQRDEPKGGNAKMKEKLSKKEREEAAKAAGADPETGEIKGDVMPDPEQQETASVKLDTFDAIATKFEADCNTAKTITDLATLRHNNRDFLAEVQQKNPPKYNFCANAFNDRIIALNGTESNMMPEV